MALNPSFPPITIVGCGPGSLDYLPCLSRQAIEEAEVLVGAARLLELFPASSAERIAVGASISSALEAMAEHVGQRKMVVLVSGDPGLCSLAQPVIRRFGFEACRVIPGISSVQVAFARLGLDWLDARLFSAHACAPEIDMTSLEREQKIAVLAGNPATMPWVLALARRMEESHLIYMCENLTLREEEVQRVSAAELAARPVVSRTVVVLVAKGIQG